MRIAGTTHPGRVRQRNEDAIGWDERLGAAVLADGMGGLRDGDLASREAVEGVLAELAARGAAGETLCDATLTGVVQSANRRGWNRCHRPYGLLLDLRIPSDGHRRTYQSGNRGR